MENKITKEKLEKYFELTSSALRVGKENIANKNRATIPV